MLLKFGIREFFDDRQLKNLSKESLSSYKFTLEEFEEYCLEKEVINVEDVNQGLVRQYLVYCKNVRGNNPTSLNHKLSNIKVFFNYLVDCEYLDYNPAKKVSQGKTEIKIDVFTDAQIKQMLAYYRKRESKEHTFHNYRNHSIIIFLLGTGARLGEVCNLKWQDVDFDNQSIVLFGKKRAASSIPLARKLKNEMLAYKIYCEKYFKGLPEYVFTDNNGEKLDVDAIKSLFKRLKKVMNFKGVRVSPHTFRHTFAHNYLMNGGDVFKIGRAHV